MNIETIKTSMSEILGMPVSRLTDDAVLADLVNDSFVLVDLVIELQDELGVLIMQEDLRSVHTVGDLTGVLLHKISARC